MKIYSPRSNKIARQQAGILNVPQATIWRGAAMLLICLLFLFVAVPKGFSFSCTCLIETRGLATNFNKFGVQYCSPDCRAHWYLEQIEVGSSYFFDDEGNVGNMASTTITRWPITNAFYSPPHFFSCLDWTCTPVITCTGTAASTLGGVSIAATLLNDCSNWTNNATGAFVDLEQWGFNSGGSPYFFENMFMDGTFVEGCTVSTHTNLATYVSLVESVGSQYTAVGSEEFTDAMLRDQIILRLGTSFSSDWSGGSAFYTLTEDHACGSGGKMQYRLKVPNSEAKAVYEVTWHNITTVVTYDCSTYTTNATAGPDQKEHITGTGDPVVPARGTIHDVDMPSVSGNMISISITQSVPNLEKVTGPDQAGH